MSDIYVIIRNQENKAMTSIEGIPVFVSARRQDNLIYDEQPVEVLGLPMLISITCH